MTSVSLPVAVGEPLVLSAAVRQVGVAPLDAATHSAGSMRPEDLRWWRYGSGPLGTVTAPVPDDCHRLLYWR
jgi:hypothetical protein